MFGFTLLLLLVILLPLVLSLSGSFLLEFLSFFSGKRRGSKYESERDLLPLDDVRLAFTVNEAKTSITSFSTKFEQIRRKERTEASRSLVIHPLNSCPLFSPDITDITSFMMFFLDSPRLQQTLLLSQCLFHPFFFSLIQPMSGFPGFFIPSSSKQTALCLFTVLCLLLDLFAKRSCNALSKQTVKKRTDQEGKEKEKTRGRKTKKRREQKESS